MLQKVLSNIDIYTDTIKGTEIPLPKLRVDIFESFVLKKRMSNNPKDYAYEDYSINFHQPFQWVQDYIRDHFNLKHNKNLIPVQSWGNIYGPLEQSYSRNQVQPLNLHEAPDYTWIYGIDVLKDSCELVMEYDDNRRAGRTWHIPLQTNKFIIFPSTQRYFISKNKGCEMNVFLTVNCKYT
tara:strand:- start:335 stop:877 length:543 start_codon:yes stop_codon:yes gene_type:complete